MAKELPSTSDRLRLTLSGWQDWDADLTGQPTPVGSLEGKSNVNYLVRSGDHEFVVRLNNDNQGLGVDRRVERQVLAEIAAADFAPSVVFVDDSVLVTNYVSGRHPTRTDLARVGRLFSRIHRTSTNVSRALDPRRQVSDYVSRIRAPLEPAIRDCQEIILSRHLPAPDSPCLCHNDLLFENMIDAGDRLVAIDWEYARPGDPAFDIAVFVETYRLDTAEVACLLSAYDGDGGDLAVRIEHYRELYALIEILWWCIRDPGAAVDTMVATLKERLRGSL
jgi:thiamine kinase